MNGCECWLLSHRSSHTPAAHRLMEARCDHIHVARMYWAGALARHSPCSHWLLLREVASRHRGAVASGARHVLQRKLPGKVHVGLVA
jgi:hypothetical protein